LIDMAVRRRIEKRIAAGAGLDAIDRAVEDSAKHLEEEERSALWLYAWHHARDPREAARRERVLELIAGERKGR
jgi:hypothetical protein